MSKKIQVWIFLIVLLCVTARNHDNKMMRDTIPAPVGVLQGSLVPPNGPQDSSNKAFEGLEKEIPLSNEKLKDLLPEKIVLCSRTKVISGHTESLGFAGIQAIYQHFPGADKSIPLEITGGAGITGDIMVNTAEHCLKMDFEEKNTIGYTRIFREEGARVREKENKFESYAAIEFITKNNSFY